MWVLIIFALFAAAVCLVAFLHGASTLSVEERVLLDTRTDVRDAQHRDAA